MKRSLTAIALIAGLALTGCSGAEAPTDAAEDSAAQPAAEETTTVPVLDQAQLEEIITSLDVDGTTFTVLDTSAMTGNEAAKMLEEAEFDPAECKDLSLAAMNASQAAGGTTVAGMASDSTMSVGLNSLDDAAAAEEQFAAASQITDSCGDVTMTVQGMEMSMSSETFEASVPGADESIGIRTQMGSDGQSMMSTSTVTSRVGNVLVTSASLSQDDPDAAVATAEALVTAVKNAG